MFRREGCRTNIQILLEHWSKLKDHPLCLKQHVSCIHIRSDRSFTIFLTKDGAEELGTNELARKFYADSPRWLEGKIEDDQRRLD